MTEPSFIEIHLNFLAMIQKIKLIDIKAAQHLKDKTIFDFNSETISYNGNNLKLRSLIKKIRTMNYL